jgi:hypothetical protein
MRFVAAHLMCYEFSSSTKFKLHLRTVLTLACLDRSWLADNAPASRSRAPWLPRSTPLHHIWLIAWIILGARAHEAVPIV